MKNIPGILVMFICILGAAACSKQAETKVFDVEYFKNNLEAREKTLKMCRNNPGELEDTPNCINAEHAQEILNASRKKAVQFESVAF